MPLLLNKWTYIVIIVIAGITALGAWGYSEYRAGGTGEKLKVATATIKLNKTLKAKDAKIVKSVPLNGDDAAIDSFLLSHTSK